MPNPTARLVGYTELITALKEMPRAVEVALRSEFRQVGQIVATDAEERLAQYSEKTARGLRPYVRMRGVEVDQTLRKTTGLRPDWGKFQMRKGLLPALDAKEDEILAGTEKALDKVAQVAGF